jgi:hypothetical protein
MISPGRPENDLLVWLARPTLLEKEVGLVQRLLETDLDWEYLFAMAHRHSVVPLIQHQLDRSASEAIPGPILSRLRRRTDENTRQNLLLSGELHKLMGRLQTQGIQAVPFKGPTLALRAYGDVALRQFGDLDILVHRCDVLKIKQLLAADGFKAIPELNRAQEAALLRFDCAYNFGNDRQVLFDVHWQLAAPYFSLGIDLDRVWERLEAVTLNGHELPSLSTGDLLVALCLHGATHGWERLGWIADVAGLMAHSPDLDLQAVLAEAGARGHGRMVTLGLFLAKDLLGAPLPAALWENVSADVVVVRLAHEVKQRLMELQPAPVGVVGELRMQLQIRERLRDKLSSAIRLSLVPRSYDWMPLPLPGWLSVLYYPWRPLRLAGKYGMRLVSNPPFGAVK